MKSAAGSSLSEGGVTPAGLKEDEEDPSESYETKDHMDTLIRAHKIINNPVHLARVHALAGRHSNAIKKINSVKDLKSLYDQKYGSGSPAQKPGKPQKNNLAVADSEENGTGDDGN